MDIDVNEELQKAAGNMHESAAALLKAGFTKEQLEHLSKYVQSTIRHSHWTIAKARSETTEETAFQTTVS